MNSDILYLGRNDLNGVMPASSESGMTTSEYAIGTVGACAIAGILIWAARQDWLRELIAGMFKKAFSVA
ncbi:DUF4244 domain-containing protein [Actinotignum urinale]|uniref:DUF4244 domain-containing protein n=1 Tax=Actinotignum urinale TaxID=190146 RepID=A0AAW9HU08_9ACTO|nr:DUF4244 domain-containing protein [Actinotignum urinale]MDY5129361.1 DUF4244 domain-containing protein [Actinotignum urinale]MDY5133749.1 DUF4244 domain-containing protein [Actinotignum urinale]MDY5151763.1 DUF4244 domain-containing protein [Actinotignum urinale]MDY5154349.1 DUF4244 domain-containing protein [Actinotignum urinale]MDY5160365.1 DUF4244 domain-containing protein [Actinotignum urinale]